MTSLHLPLYRQLRRKADRDWARKAGVAGRLHIAARLSSENRELAADSCLPVQNVWAFSMSALIRARRNEQADRAGIVRAGDRAPVILAVGRILQAPVGIGDDLACALDDVAFRFFADRLRRHFAAVVARTAGKRILPALRPGGRGLGVVCRSRAGHAGRQNGGGNARNEKSWECPKSLGGNARMVRHGSFLSKRVRQALACPFPGPCLPIRRLVSRRYAASGNNAFLSPRFRWWSDSFASAIFMLQCTMPQRRQHPHCKCCASFG